ncbi:MAG: hypothetical protein FWC91_03895 [Defluviitaleaceae bacterium]|nr:hypothetical protein [Defluviitaleaceae bacterium]
MAEHKRNPDDCIWKNFTNLLHEPHIFKSHLNYYNALTGWVKKYYNEIGNDLVQRNGLDAILNIDFEKYLSKESEISLKLEQKRIFTRKPETLDALLMIINNTIWDMIRLYSEKDCPICDGELYYVIFEKLNTKQRDIGLECCLCWWHEYINKPKECDEMASVHPVSRTDLELFGVKSQK